MARGKDERHNPNRKVGKLNLEGLSERMGSFVADTPFNSSSYRRLVEEQTGYKYPLDEQGNPVREAD